MITIVIPKSKAALGKRDGRLDDRGEGGGGFRYCLSSALCSLCGSRSWKQNPTGVRENNTRRKTKRDV